MISKADAEKTAKVTYEVASKALEERIDNEIRRNTAGSIYVDVAGVPRTAVDAVAEAYRANGCTVHFTDSQHDGATLTLS